MHSEWSLRKMFRLIEKRWIYSIENSTCVAPIPCCLSFSFHLILLIENVSLYVLNLSKSFTTTFWFHFLTVFFFPHIIWYNIRTERIKYTSILTFHKLLPNIPQSIKINVKSIDIFDLFWTFIWLTISSNNKQILIDKLLWYFPETRLWRILSGAQRKVCFSYLKFKSFFWIFSHQVQDSHFMRNCGAHRFNR